MKKVSTSETKTRSRLSRLIRKGIVRPARAPLSSTLFTDQPPRPKGGALAVVALIEERRDGR